MVSCIIIFRIKTIYQLIQHHNSVQTKDNKLLSKLQVIKYLWDLKYRYVQGFWHTLESWKENWERSHVWHLSGPQKLCDLRLVNNSGIRQHTRWWVTGRLWKLWTAVRNLAFHGCIKCSKLGRTCCLRRLIQPGLCSAKIFQALLHNWLFLNCWIKPLTE